ncbi:MAG: hypothetical protein GF308_01625 [Candidatus Heimdallarchaeota archaeon]|nr:hypothetical protein [Candidatus Heimdallarchaeota archaeon]
MTVKSKTLEESIEISKENQKLLIWHIIGGLVIILLGTIFHFIFEWSNYWKPVGWFVAVNESVWEHFKLGFWPGIMFYLVEFFFLRKKTNNYWIAKGIALYLNPIIIAMLFYTYRGALGIESLIIDILTFMIAVIIQQYVSYKIVKAEKISEKFDFLLNIGAIIAILILTTMFVVFTYYPPQIPLFYDMEVGGYGILN